MQCVHCGHEVSTPFCPSCGQRSGVKRITLRDTLSDFWMNVVGFDGMFLRTLKDLTRRPGQVASSYIRGVRVLYFGPISYFFFMITLLLLWVSILGMDFAELIRDRQQVMALDTNNSRGIALVTRWVADHIKWVLFLAVPFQAIAARHFFFRKSGYNLMEHTVPLFYTSGHLFWVSMMAFVVLKVAGEQLSIASSLLSVLYFGYVYADLMQYQSRLKAFLKGIGVYVGGQLLFVATMMVMVIVVVLILAVVYPPALDAIKPSRQ
ncbi:MAG: DUF3667 domain-containing protein [Cyclobacteriaceae bacterium]|nr:DUF3667 domain-containing protein [Cyclobacteriaceae bacterium]